VECRPVRKFVYVLAETVNVPCTLSQPSALIFRLDLPIHGKIVGAFRSAGFTSGVAESEKWLISATGAETSLGESAPLTKFQGPNWIFSGDLKESERKIKLKLALDRPAGICSPDAVQLQKGATLQIWVEDATPGCQGKDILTSGRNSKKAFSCSWASDTTSLSDQPVTLLETKGSLTEKAWVKVMAQLGMQGTWDIRKDSDARVETDLDTLPLKGATSLDFRGSRYETNELLLLDPDSSLKTGEEFGAKLRAWAGGKGVSPRTGAKFCAHGLLLTAIAERGPREETRIELLPDGTVKSTLYCTPAGACSVNSSLPSAEELASISASKPKPKEPEKCTETEYLRRKPNLTGQYAENPMLHYSVIGKDEGMCEPSLGSGVSTDTNTQVETGAQ
jgi:hypothetical protein